MQREIDSILPGDGPPVVHRAVDLRYLGQEHTVTVTLADLSRDFNHRAAKMRRKPVHDH